MGGDDCKWFDDSKRNTVMFPESWMCKCKVCDLFLSIKNYKCNKCVDKMLNDSLVNRLTRLNKG